MKHSVKLIVTGAAGHLGSHLMPALAQRGFAVIGIDRAPPPSPLPEGCTFVQADLADADWEPALADAEGIVHCASLHPWKSYTDAQYLDANVKGTWNLYAAAVRTEVRRVVLTSSIAAAGYQNIPTDAWPVREDAQFPLGDLYSFTKHAQEDIARHFAHSHQIQTVALRPPTFVPLPELQTAFSLTGNFAVVEDMVSAHVAAVEVILGLRRPARPLERFEAIHVTNELPYTLEDAQLLEPGRNVRPLVEKYWPDLYSWLVERGYRGHGIMALYDNTKAHELLGWRARWNLEAWVARMRST